MLERIHQELNRRKIANSIHDEILRVHLKEGCPDLWITADPDDDVTLFFQGSYWHTHADLLEGDDPAEAVADFCAAILAGRFHVIRLVYPNGALEIRVADDLEDERSLLEPGETLEVLS
jgi:hypothetical protein